MFPPSSYVHVRSDKLADKKLFNGWLLNFESYYNKAKAVFVCECDRLNLLNGTRDRYEIRHTGRLGKYKTKLVNTFFDLVTPGHKSLLLHYCST